MDGLILEKLQVMIEASTKPFRDEIKKAQDYVKETTKVVNAEVNKIKGLFKSLGRFVITL